MALMIRRSAYTLGNYSIQLLLTSVRQDTKGPSSRQKSSVGDMVASRIPL